MSSRSVEYLRGAAEGQFVKRSSLHWKLMNHRSDLPGWNWPGRILGAPERGGYCVFTPGYFEDELHFILELSTFF